MEGNSIFHAFNIYFAIFALFCFKLLIKISLALLTHFYIVKGNRKEAARIAEEIYGIAPGSWADRSPLHEAAFQGRQLSLKTLIAQGFNVNIVTIDQVSALHEACLGGHVACAKVLLENGAQVNAVTIDGITPLFNACCSGSAACVNMLLEFGATPQLENHLASPIHEAVKRGHRECMEILVANDVDTDQEDSQHGTPLYVACMYQRTDCVKKLLELGASVDLGKQLDTPLHAAVRKSSAEAVNLLTDYGASLTRRNAEFKCALDLAAPTSEVEQALLLREEATLRSRLPVLSTAQRLQNLWKKLRKSKEDMLQSVMQYTVTENQKVQDWRERESKILQKNAADRKKSTKQLISILAHQADSIQALVAMQAENYCAPSPVPKLFPLCPNVSSKPPSPASRFLPPPAASNTCALTKTSPENYDHYPLHSAPMQYSHPEVQQSLHSTPDRTYSNL